MQLSDVQKRKAAALINNVKNLPFYRAKLQNITANVDNVTDILQSMPIMGVDDFHILSKNIKYAHSDIQFIDRTSGTTGKPKEVCVTEKDHLVELEHAKNTINAFGLSKEDVFLSYDLWFPRFYDLFEAALDDMNIPHHRFKLEDFNDVSKAFAGKPTVIFTVPSIVSRSWKSFEENQKKYKCVKKLIYVGEKPTSQFRGRLNKLGIEVFSDYGTTETFTIGRECDKHCGEHLATDSFIFELADECKISENVSEGKLIVTNLDFEGTPIIRYLIGDVVQLIDKPCACGLTTSRVNILARRSNIFTIYGSDFYISSIENAVESATKQPTPFQLQLYDGEKMGLRIVSNIKFKKYRDAWLKNILAVPDIKQYYPQNLEITFQFTDKDADTHKLKKFIDLRDI
jgi:phenylacetate-coenzyme A ligase PaaK-like adenylate-forming protein